MMNIHRFLALTRKEFYQMLRDPSSFLIGIVIPLMLIVLMGSGLSLDVKNLPVAVALEDTSPTARDALSFLNGSPYFSPSYVTSSKEAIALMDARQAVREAMMAERKAGHWADPSVDDDRHDETSLFGRGETADDEDVEQ